MPFEVTLKALKSPTVQISGLSARSKTTGIPISILPGVTVCEMFAKTFALLRLPVEVAFFENTVGQGALPIVFMMCVLNVFQPFVFASKDALFRRAGRVWTFPFGFSIMLCGFVAVEVRHIPERLHVETARLVTQKRFGVDVL